MAHFEPKIKVWGGAQHPAQTLSLVGWGHLPTPYHPWRLRHLEPCAFGARPTLYKILNVPLPMTPKFELWRDFCTVHLATKFHHPMFNCSEIIVLTNKPTNPQTNNRTPLKTSTPLRYATPVGKDRQTYKSLIIQRHQAPAGEWWQEQSTGRISTMSYEYRCYGELPACPALTAVNGRGLTPGRRAAWYYRSDRLERA